MRAPLLFAFFFALAARPAAAQLIQKPAPAPVPQTTGLPASPNAAPAAAVPAYHRGYTDKHLGGTTSPTFPNGLPERDLDHGTSRADQPRANQSQSGARPTRSILGRRK